VRAVVDDIERLGNTAVVVRINGRTAGVLGLADRPRDEAADAVTQLTDLTGTVPVLLTGDNLHAAAHIADELGIRDVRAGL
ncbi:heavy metal translocating P-type ATPase, partial [Mycobacterium sp. ITM-2017-0098]